MPPPDRICGRRRAAPRSAARRDGSACCAWLDEMTSSGPGSGRLGVRRRRHDRLVARTGQDLDDYPPIDEGEDGDEEVNRKPVECPQCRPLFCRESAAPDAPGRGTGRSGSARARARADRGAPAAGCGGSSLGWSMAGYRELVAVEWQADACELLRANLHPEVKVHHGDITQVDPAVTGAGEGAGRALDGCSPRAGGSIAGAAAGWSDRAARLFERFVRAIGAQCGPGCS